MHTLTMAVLRLAKALIPVEMLWVSKLMIDGMAAFIAPGKLDSHVRTRWILGAGSTSSSSTT